MTQDLQTVTGLPAVLLKWKGRRDARRGLTAVTAYVERLTELEASLECALARKAEETLGPVRETAAGCLLTLGQEEPVSPETGVRGIRAARRRADAKQQAAASLLVCRERIGQEELILKTSIIQTRQLAGEKLHSYVAGVRRYLPSYELPGLFAGHNAFEMYAAQHRELDEAVRKAAAQLLEKGGGE